MANITLLGASYTDVPAVDLPQTGGGTVRFYENGGGGGSALATETGTFTGSGGITAQISCDFQPDLIYIYGDLSSSVSLRGVVSIIIIKDSMLLVIIDGSQSAAQEVLSEAYHGITGYNENNQVSGTYATYANNTLTINTVVNTSTRRFASGVTYSYKLVGWS